MNRKELDKYLTDGIAKFKQHGSGLMGIAIIPAHCWEQMIAAGNRGDMEARAAVLAINDWLTLATDAEGTGTYPGCVGCSNKLLPGDVGGWGILRPPDLKDQRGGLVVAFCDKCIERSHDDLLRAFMNTLEADGVGRVERVQ